MKFLRIYKNDELLMSGSSIEKYEEQSTVSGVYPLNGLIVTILGEESEVSTKILSEVNFTLTKEHKAELIEKFKIYIDEELPNFKHEKEAYLEIEYGDEIYKFDPKAAQSSLEKKIVRAMSLCRIFLDPKDEDKIKIVFKTSAE